VKKYIDFDGVIMDTYLPIFGDYQKVDLNGRYISDKEHVQMKDWNSILADSLEINNSLEIIKSLSNVSILTRVYSMGNEGVAKIEFLRRMGINCDVILAPYQLKKTEVVNARGSILVDDAIFNLDDWNKAGGVPIFFNKDGMDTDGWGVKNKKYVKTRTLEILRKFD